MKTFEYKLVVMPTYKADTTQVANQLNTYGDQGWELTTTQFGYFIFKREKMSYEDMGVHNG